jgi:hypothetical protein
VEPQLLTRMTRMGALMHTRATAGAGSCVFAPEMQRIHCLGKRRPFAGAGDAGVLLSCTIAAQIHGRSCAWRPCLLSGHVPAQARSAATPPAAAGRYTCCHELVRNKLQSMVVDAQQLDKVHLVRASFGSGATMCHLPASQHRLRRGRGGGG